MGYISASCLSPGQVDVANRVFLKDEELIKKAQYIKEIFEQNRANGLTGFSDDKYGFIDEPIYKDALLQLNLKF
jgi:citrate lyase subunit beta/citryl-CoA lyase